MFGAVPLLHDLAQDARHGARPLLRSPGFTAVVILTLALGIGANAAIFRVVKAVLLTPLPYRDASRLVSLAESSDGSSESRVKSVDYTRVVTPSQRRPLAHAIAPPLN